MTRLEMVQKIIDFEARRDKQGKIILYRLPSNDGGGAWEYAGINDKYHPEALKHIRELIKLGREDDAEFYALRYIANYTDPVALWDNDRGVQFFLRDTAWNRGVTGAAKILQIAVGAIPDGKVGAITRGLVNSMDAETLLKRLRTAREEYELKIAGKRENLWAGLQNRWNNVLKFALT